MLNFVFGTFLVVCSASSFASSDESSKSDTNRPPLKRKEMSQQPADQVEATTYDQRLEARRQSTDQERLRAAERLARAAAESLAVKQRAAVNITTNLQTDFIKCVQDKNIPTEDVKKLIATMLKDTVPEEHFGYYYAIATNRRKPELMKKSVEWLHEYITILRPISSALYNKYIYRQRWPMLNLGTDPLPDPEKPEVPPAFDHWRTRRT